MEFQGKLDGKDSATNSKLRLQLDANTADVNVGGNGRGGDIEIRDDKNVATIRLEGGGSESPLATPEIGVPPIIQLSAADGSIRVGGVNKSGTVALRSGDNGVPPIIQLSAADGSIKVGGVNKSGTVALWSGDNKERIHLDAATADLKIGGGGTNGSLSLSEGEDNKRRIHLDAGEGNVWIGGNGVHGDLLLFHRDATDLDNPATATVSMSARAGSIRLRGLDDEGQLGNRIFVDGEGGNIWLGGNGANGNLLLFNDEGDNSSTEQATVRISGRDGDIVLRNADCAEDFDISESIEVEPGTVVVIDDEGKLRPTLVPYDKKVAGVISGAGECKPALILDKRKSAAKRLPVALVGKVYCKVDAQYASIEVGDLLTTSPTLGHAMRAADPLKAFGAVIGKALRSVKSGQGLIPILIALQ